MDTPVWNVSHTELLLVGFLNLQQYRPFLFIPFFIMFVFTMVTNGALIYVIAAQRSLHSPMYMLILSIACLDFTVPLIIVPRMLFSFASSVYVITRHECLIQMFCIHYSAIFQSTILLGMSIDRYVAICNPLRYSSWMSLSNCLKITSLLLIRNTTVILLMVGLVGTLTFCSSDRIYHCYCEHTIVVNLACGDTSRNQLAGLLGFCVPSMDCVCIVLSYLFIFRAIFNSAAGESRQKAIHTCSSHLIVICVAYLSTVTAFLGYRLKDAVPQDVRVLTSLMYLLVPGVSNPVIYGVRTKEIRVHLLRLVKC